MSFSKAFIERVEWLETFLARHHPWWWSVVCNFPIVLNENVPEEAFGLTEGTYIHFGPKAQSLEPKERLLGLLGHEANHIFFHHTKPPPRVAEPRYYRLAMEYEAEIAIPPEFPHIDDDLTAAAADFARRGLTDAPSIYLALLKERPSLPLRWPDVVIIESGSGKIGEQGIILGPSGKPVKPSSLDQVIAKILSAAEMTKSHGSIPYGVRMLVQRISKPHIPWREELKHYWGTKVGLWDLRADRFSNTFLGMGMYVPPLDRTHGTPDVVWGIDSSGSMVGHPLEAVITECSGLVGLLTDLEVFVFDAAIQQQMRFDDLTHQSIEEMRKLKGGGGTSFVPFFEEVKKREMKPQLAMIFTDLYGTFPNEVPDYPVLWVTTSNRRQAPFGDVLRIPREELEE